MRPVYRNRRSHLTDAGPVDNRKRGTRVRIEPAITSGMNCVLNVAVVAQGAVSSVVTLGGGMCRHIEKSACGRDSCSCNLLQKGHARVFGTPTSECTGRA